MPKVKQDSQPQKLVVKPLFGYILVEPIASETTTASGIVLPESTQEKPAQGVVLAVADEIVLDSGKVIKSPVSVGQTVFYKKWAVGDEIKVLGKEYKLVKFEDLMAVLEDSK
jgi:chaperonin GroES